MGWFGIGLFSRISCLAKYFIINFNILNAQKMIIRKKRYFPVKVFDASFKH